MKIKDLDLKTITIIQLAIATLIGLMFQFLFPLNWQPLDYYLYGPDIQHGDPGTNIVIFTISMWYFSLSIAWFVYLDNPHINNFLIYSVIPLGGIVISEFVLYLFFWDYIHILPIIIATLIYIKKRETLSQKYVIPYSIFITIWMFSVHLFKLAYYDSTTAMFTFNTLLIIGLSILMSFAFREKRD